MSRKRKKNSGNPAASVLYLGMTRAKAQAILDNPDTWFNPDDYPNGRPTTVEEMANPVRRHDPATLARQLVDAGFITPDTEVRGMA
jgi:hypothetical protein